MRHWWLADERGDLKATGQGRADAGRMPHLVIHCHLRAVHLSRPHTDYPLHCCGRSLPPVPPVSFPFERSPTKAFLHIGHSNLRRHFPRIPILHAVATSGLAMTRSSSCQLFTFLSLTDWTTLLASMVREGVSNMPLYQAIPSFSCQVHCTPAWLLRSHPLLCNHGPPACVKTHTDRVLEIGEVVGECTTCVCVGVCVCMHACVCVCVCVRC